jgi:hypothetical protein
MFSRVFLVFYPQFSSLLDIFLFFVASVLSGDIRKAVFLFLPLVCLARTETGEICKCLLGDFEGVVAGDLRTDTEVEAELKHCLWNSSISIFVLQCGFLTDKVRTSEYVQI